MVLLSFFSLTLGTWPKLEAKPKYSNYYSQKNEPIFLKQYKIFFISKTFV